MDNLTEGAGEDMFGPSLGTRKKVLKWWGNIRLYSEKISKNMKTLKWWGNIVNIPTFLGTKGPGSQFFSRQGGGCSTLLVVGGLPEQIGSTLVGDARWIVSTVSLRNCVWLISSHLWGKDREKYAWMEKYLVKSTSKKSYWNWSHQKTEVGKKD